MLVCLVPNNRRRELERDDNPEGEATLAEVNAPRISTAVYSTEFVLFFAFWAMVRVKVCLQVRRGSTSESITSRMIPPRQGQVLGRKWVFLRDVLLKDVRWRTHPSFDLEIFAPSFLCLVRVYSVTVLSRRHIFCGLLKLSWQCSP